MLEIEAGFMMELLTAYLQQLLAETVASRGFLIPKFKNRSELLEEVSRGRELGPF